MLIDAIYTHNNLRNFNYIIACPNTLEALVIDPLDVAKILGVAQEKGYKITKIVNTHEHHDHIGGNEELVNATGAKIYAHALNLETIANVSHPVDDHDIITVGNSVTLQVLSTPGHTMTHICLFHPQTPALFCGDTLFNAGVGNCYSGSPQALYHSIQRLAKLPQNTQVYPGHDYLENNLRFTLSVEPNNTQAQELLAQLSSQNSYQFVSTIGIEHQINSFFRIANRSLVESLQLNHKIITFTEEEVFLELRSLRDKW